MTKEQEEAISTMQHWIDYEKRNKDKIQKADELIEIQETVLSMLKEQQEENKKKDKIIDLIINEFYKRVKISENCYIQKSKGINDCLKYKNCKDCIKQYFERKVEEK